MDNNGKVIEKAIEKTTEKIVIGDIHGDIELLNTVLDFVKDYKPENVIFLGDYVDRGKNSKEVVSRLMETDYVCLMGNHDKMLLDFVDNGDMLSLYNDWNINTLRSFFGRESDFWHYDSGYNLYKITMFGISDINKSVQKRLGETKEIEWIRSLPYYHVDDSHIYVHGGLDMSLDNPLDTSESEMIWCRPNNQIENKTGKKIVVGHTIVDKITEYSNGIVMVDCGNSFRNTAFVYSTTRGVIDLHNQCDK